MPGHLTRPAPLFGMDWIQTLVLAVLQGITELFPVSSLGHTVVIPGAVGWGDLLNRPLFLPLVVMLHVGTATALVIYFWRDWAEILRGLLRSVARRKISTDPNERLAWFIVLGTIPPGLIGLIWEKQISSLFAAPSLAAAFLIVNGVILFLGELLRRRAEPKDMQRGGQELNFREINDLNWQTALFIGAMQSLAFIPGISRTGVTMVAGLSSGLTHRAAARFALLLATPLILAAGILEVRKLLLDSHALLLALVGGLVAGLAAYLSARFLMRYFALGRLDPFAFYCVGFGLLALGLFWFTSS